MKRPAATQRRQGATAAGDAVAAAMEEIPRGQTRSKMEVFRKALQHLGRGDEGIDTGVRARLGFELKRLCQSRAAGWHRVVASDGAFGAEEQLSLLQKEGARPRPGESVASWAQRCDVAFVGTYRSALQRACRAGKDPGIAKWPAWSVEPIKSKAHLKERLLLSGGKLFHLEGARTCSVPAFQAPPPSRCSAKPKSLQDALKIVAPRLKKAFNSKQMQELRDTGATRLRRILHSQECAQLLQYAEEANAFDEVRRLDGEAGQGGAYYFCKQPPHLVEAIRTSLYAQLLEQLPELGERYGATMAQLERRCAEAGQKRCATIFLAFGEGGLNLAHQDPYGKLFFPYQAMLMLSRRGKDFNGGEFFVKNMKTGKVAQVAADQGDVTLFAANSAAVRGADFKHGVREVKGERFSVGIVFNRRK
ncbi:unnamed protein product [Durusdinium trenchii]|uniref:Fe2OG dioxygenase domain-containing protein n=3 Tax=Durusdinium trenchii TaxID=1381693 RepID=A0ABP0NHI1_9DINO